MHVSGEIQPCNAFTCKQQSAIQMNDHLSLLVPNAPNDTDFYILSI